jgi:FlaA1/EpsC-like NDP-sugar epimerase
MQNDIPHIPFQKQQFFNLNFFIVLASDVVFLCAAWYAAYLVRFDFSIPGEFREHMLEVLPVLIGAKVVCFYFFDVYRGMWRFTSVSELINIIKAAGLATLLVIFFVFGVYRFAGFSRSIFLIDWCFTILVIAGSRLGIRLFFQKFVPSQPILSLLAAQRGLAASAPRKTKRRLLVIGAGICGEKILREIGDNPQLRYDVVGFLDDAPSKTGRMIHGVRVLGTTHELMPIAEHAQADEALIAIPSASAEQMRRIVSLCKQSGIDFKTVPSYGELIDGKVTLKAIREVAYRDLIGRATVKLDEKTIGDCLRGRRVLVTGAGGSIGSELCRQICRFHPEKVVLFDRVESPLYEIDLELKHSFSSIGIEPILGDTQDKDHIFHIFRTHGPQVVFHAAAYKHVPMLEAHPWKAVENNVFGTLNLVTAANEFGCDRFVLVSTDKAVKPANVMGASKRIAEMITLNFNSCNATLTRFMAVRFGNVIGSVGSVVPLFKKQIEAGGPVTVTHREVTRFFMTVKEACQLILQAGALGSGGEIFVLDMGTPVKIFDMARDLIRLSGYEPDVDIKIDFIGLRPGEKLYEELITAGENTLPTPHEKILMLKGDACDLDLLNGRIQELAAVAQGRDAGRIRSMLMEIVPEYSPADTASEPSAAAGDRGPTRGRPTVSGT